MIGTTFKIKPARWPATVFLLVMALVISIPFVVFVRLTGVLHGPARWVFIVPVILFIGVLGLLSWIFYACHYGRFIVSSEGLQAKSFIFSKKIGVNELRVDNIRTMNLKTDLRMKPFIRTCGVGIFGYGEGWFRSRDWGKLLVYMTDMDDVVVIETTHRYAILLTPENPSEFIKEAARQWGKQSSI